LGRSLERKREDARLESGDNQVPAREDLRGARQVLTILNATVAFLPSNQLKVIGCL
jgi:hypothetical protein